MFFELQVEEVGGAAGRSCGEVTAGTNATVLGIRHGAQVVAGPTADHPLAAGDILMLLGDERAIAAIGARI